MAGSDAAPARLGYDEYLHLIRQADELLASFESHPDEATRERVVALLTAIDLLHRTGLRRLADALREQGAGAALEGAARDPVVRTLLGLYELADLEIPEEEEGAAAGTPPGVTFVPRERLTMRAGGGRT